MHFKWCRFVRSKWIIYSLLCIDIKNSVSANIFHCEQVLHSGAALTALKTKIALLDSYNIVSWSAGFSRMLVHQPKDWLLPSDHPNCKAAGAFPLVRLGCWHERKTHLSVCHRRNKVVFLGRSGLQFCVFGICVRKELHLLERRGCQVRATHPPQFLSYGQWMLAGNCSQVVLVEVWWRHKENWVTLLGYLLRCPPC